MIVVNFKYLKGCCVGFLETIMDARSVRQQYCVSVEQPNYVKILNACELSFEINV